MKKLIDLFQTAVFTVPFLVIFAFIVFIIASIMGCQKPQKPKPIVEPRYRTQLKMSPAMNEAVMNLVWLKSDPNVFKIKEVDPFRRQ